MQSGQTTPEFKPSPSCMNPVIIPNSSPIVGIGCDVVENHKILTALKRSGPRWLKRIYSPSEQNHFYTDTNLNNDVESFENINVNPQIVEFLASRWAVKEATIKAFSQVDEEQLILPTDISICYKEGSKSPFINPGTSLNKLMIENSIESFVSLSHSETCSMAVVLFQINKQDIK